jgi:hypothetical protein
VRMSEERERCGRVGCLGFLFIFKIFF